MSRLLLLGCSPLPGEPGLVAAGPGLRAWQFLRPLREAGHDVTFLALRPTEDASARPTEAAPDPAPTAVSAEDARSAAPPSSEPRSVRLDDGFAYRAFDPDAFADADAMARAVGSPPPDAILGVGSILPAPRSTDSCASRRRRRRSTPSAPCRPTAY